MPSTFTVTSTTDPATLTSGTLRWAIEQADEATTPSTIDFDLGSSPQTITLTQGQLELSNASDATTIDGPSAGVTISGGGLNREFQVDPGVTASLSGLTISGGSASYGAGLQVEGTVTVTACTITGDTAGTAGGGVQVNAAAMATLIDSIVSQDSSRYGGAINDDGTVTLIDCTVSADTASVQAGGLRIDAWRHGLAHRQHVQR